VISIINTAAPSDEYRLRVNRGLVPGVVGERRTGHIDNLGTTFEDVWSGVGDIPFLQAAQPLRLRAGDAADTYTGSGARVVALRGIGADWRPLTQLVQTGGASPSVQTAQPFIRLLEAVVFEEVGIYGGSSGGSVVGTNVGDIEIEEVGGSSLVAKIPAGAGRAEMGFYSVPLGKQAHLCQVDMNVETAVSYDLEFYIRQRGDIVAAPFAPVVRVGRFEGLTERANRNFCTYPNALEPCADFWIRAKSSTGNAALAIDFHMLICDMEAN
jgi:hypothetical protein